MAFERMGRPVVAAGRCVVGGALVVGALCGAGLAVADPAGDTPRPPNCTAADLAGIAGGVATATSAYLFTHPDVNEFYTGLHGADNEDVPESTRAYFEAHPQELAELKGIRQPLVDFRERCGYAVADRVGQL